MTLTRKTNTFGPNTSKIYSIYLFGVLCRFQHCTGHITTGSWKGRGNQYIQFTRVVYCKLPTNSKQLPAFPLKAITGMEPPTSEVGGESVTVGAQLRSQPILRWAIAQLRILGWVAYLKGSLSLNILRWARTYQPNLGE